MHVLWWKGSSPRCQNDLAEASRVVNTQLRQELAQHEQMIRRVFAPYEDVRVRDSRCRRDELPSC